ncbi:MAG TPA: rod-binding protein [Caulobacter sp.]|nr:rod-binding protein [Caulobacter sp.]
MGVTAAIAPPVDVLLAQGQARTLARAKVKETAQAYEASFLSVMLAQMFKDVGAEAPFGGGEGEAMFKSFFTDAVAKQVSRAGGIGLAGPVEREMLKLQGLQEEVPHGA